MFTNVSIRMYHVQKSRIIYYADRKTILYSNPYDMTRYVTKSHKKDDLFALVNEDI